MILISDQSIQLMHDQFVGADLPAHDHPTVYAMCGIPGAGKSSFVKQMRATGVFPEQAFTLNPDMVMEALPEYCQLKSQSGAEEAFLQLEMPTRDLAYSMLGIAQERRLDIIKDMGCTRQENLNKLIDLKSSGYRIKTHYIEVDPETAIRRIQTRERHTPTAMIHERYEALRELLPQLRGLSDEFLTYNNDQDSQPAIEATKEEKPCLKFRQSLPRRGVR